jgi:hypothetical protein
VGPRASLDTIVKRKIPSLCQDSNPDHTAQHYTIELSWLLTEIVNHNNCSFGDNTSGQVKQNLLEIITYKVFLV